MKKLSWFAGVLMILVSCGENMGLISLGRGGLGKSEESSENSEGTANGGKKRSADDNSGDGGRNKRGREDDSDDSDDDDDDNYDDDDDDESSDRMYVRISHGNLQALRCTEWRYRIKSSRIWKLKPLSLEQGFLFSDQVKRLDKETIEVRTTTVIAPDGVIAGVLKGSTVSLEGEARNCLGGSPVAIKVSFKASAELDFRYSPLPGRMIRAVPARPPFTSGLD